MIHLDTHALVWLYEGRRELFPEAALLRLRALRPVISPMARLELSFLREIGRIRVEPAAIVEAMRAEADLMVAESAWPRVASIAAGLTWTRDPFDRLIAAHAMADDLPLLTRDATLLASCPVACWG